VLKTVVQKIGDGAGPSEAELVVGARAGDPAAIRELIRRLNPRLFRVARGVLDTDAEAEDAVQDAYLAAFTRLDTFRGEARFSTWVTRIVLNAAAMRKRGAKQHESYDTVIETDANQSSVVPFPAAVIERPEVAMARREVREILETAIATLPAPLRVVFLMYESEGMDIGAIGRDLGLNPITVRTRLFRARRKLRAVMEEALAGGFSSVFPFGGKRCQMLTERVMLDLAAKGVLRP